MLQYYDTPALSSMSGLKTTDGNEVDDSNEADTTARKPIWEAHIASAKVDSESGVLICGVGFDKKAQRDVLEVSFPPNPDPDPNPNPNPNPNSNPNPDWRSLSQTVS